MKTEKAEIKETESRWNVKIRYACPTAPIVTGWMGAVMAETSFNAIEKAIAFSCFDKKFITEISVEPGFHYDLIQF